MFQSVTEGVCLFFIDLGIESMVCISKEYRAYPQILINEHFIDRAKKGLCLTNTKIKNQNLIFDNN